MMCFVNQGVVNGGMSMSWEAKWLSPRVVGRKGFLWTTYSVRKFPTEDIRRVHKFPLGDIRCAHDAGRRASVPQGWQHPGHPSTSERNLASFPRISFPHSLLPSFFNLIPIIISPVILALQPLYSSSWSSPQCDQHLWMIGADLLLGSELQAMQNQFILLRCHPASRFIIITSIEIIIINTIYNVNIK